MKIGIDAMVMSLSSGGIGRYSFEMIQALANNPDTINHEFILYPGINTPHIKLPENWQYSSKKIPSKGIVRSFIFPLIAKADNLDLFYSSAYFGPVFPMPCIYVTTVHDIIATVYPRIPIFKHRMIERYLMPRSFRYASTILADSLATRNDILRHMDIPADKIRVIYAGKNQSFKVDDTDQEATRKVLAHYGLQGRPYIFYLGDSGPRKNIQGIIKAFSLMPDTILSNCALFLGGNIKMEQVCPEGLPEKLRMGENVILGGFVADEHLPYLYNAARGFCFSSLYEGFGLPVLEAMACGCPVITSNVSSLPEVVGDAGMLVDPYNTQEIADAIARLFVDDELYAELRNRGLRQAQKFSWEDAAHEVFKLFLSL